MGTGVEERSSTVLEVPEVLVEDSPEGDAADVDGPAG